MPMASVTSACGDVPDSCSNNDIVMIRKKQHLDWSDKQRRILTANGTAEQWYCADRGFPFTEAELPHYYISNNGNTTRKKFKEWKLEKEEAYPQQPNSPIVGVWKRTLFFGGFEYATDHDEFTCNAQTNTLFIDLRIPWTREDLLLKREQSTTIQSLNDMNGEQLRLYARQHIFAGYTSLQTSNQTEHLVVSASYPYCATRFHCMDWNYVGVPRTRPNKWWVEIDRNIKEDSASVWKEWAYATNQYNQHYYCEFWERWNPTAFVTPKTSPKISFRKDSDSDGILIIVEDHIVYCLDRSISNPSNHELERTSSPCSSLAAVVDEAILQNSDLDTARAWLSMKGGHGRWVSSPAYCEHGRRGDWILDHCIEFWMQGRPLFGRNSGGSTLEVVGTSTENCTLLWNHESWSVFESNLLSVDSIRDVLLNGPCLLH
jgi:hypothetical protein